MGQPPTDLNEIIVFVRVVQAASIRGAATQLGMPKSTVSRKLSDLEERLSARLVQRTTRKLSLTDVGRAYYEQCARIIGEIEDAERDVRRQQAAPSGLLRVSAPLNIAFLGPVLSDYLKRYPEVRLEVSCTERAVNLVEERFDLAIRTGVLADSTLIARSLGTIRWILVATPDYLKKRGRPKTPHDLKGHDCLLFGAAPNLRLHCTKGKKGAHEVPVPARFSVTDMDVLHLTATDGLGIALLPAFLCAKELSARTLERVLPDWDAVSTPVHVVYPGKRHVSPTVTSFVEHLRESVISAPWGPDPHRRRTASPEELERRGRGVTGR